ncbi:LptF/LptG family permease [bacterium]|nr:LptF/LptG family permease [bacterium]
MIKILDRYIIREFIPPFFGGLCLFVFVLLMDKALKLTELVFMKGVGINEVGELFFFLIPPLLSFTIPMAVLFAALMAFGRLASDNEVSAFWSCGLHPVRIIAPVLGFGILAAFACFWLEVSIKPSANKDFRSFVLSLQQKKAFLALNEQEFQELDRDIAVYVQGIKKIQGEEMGYNGVLIADQRVDGQARVIIAEEGAISLNKSDGKLTLSLIDGSVHDMGQKAANDYRLVNFGHYDMALAMPLIDSGGKLRRKELSFHELSALLKSDSTDINQKTELRLEWHRRFAFPAACFVFAFIGSLIGMMSKWSGKGSSFAISIVLILIYYIIMILGIRLSMAGYMVPWISVWIPNLFFLGMCFWLFMKEAL